MLYRYEIFSVDAWGEPRWLESADCVEAVRHRTIVLGRRYPKITIFDSKTGYTVHPVKTETSSDTKVRRNNAAANNR